MKLYHGSNVVIDSINLALCRPYKDFGRGFYMTDIEEQAEKMAIRVSRIYGGTPIVNAFELQEDFKNISGMRIKDFGIQTTEEWATFVMNNRSREFEDVKSILCNKDNKYDIAIGPVADDNMALLFRQYENEIIDFDTLLKGMIYKKHLRSILFIQKKVLNFYERQEIGVDKKEQLIEYAIQDIVDMLTTDQNIEYDEAMNKFYNSEVFVKLQDKETGLYMESPEYVYDLFKDEMNFGRIIQAEI